MHRFPITAHRETELNALSRAQGRASAYRPRFVLDGRPGAMIVGASATTVAAPPWGPAAYLRCAVRSASMNEVGRNSARYALLVLFLINFLNFFDRIIPAALNEPIRKEFAVGDTQMGLLGTAFTLIYAIAGIPLGRLADRVLRPRLLAIGVMFWSAMTAASGLASGFTTYMLSRIGVGIGEASCAPAANAMIGDLYPPHRRARALGWFMLGLPLGSLTGFAIVGQVAQAFGWRMAFLMAALPGVIVALLAWRLRDPLRGAQEAYRVDAATPLDRPFLRLLRIPTLWWIILSGASFNFAAYAFGNFLPALMMRQHGVDVAQAGTISAIVLGVTGVIGLAFGGMIVDAVHARMRNGRLRLGCASVLVAAPLLWMGLNQPAGAVFASTTLLALGWMLSFIYYVSVYPSVQEVVDPRLRGTAMSVYFLFQYLLGAGFGTVVAGALSDAYAKRAMHLAQVSEMSESFRATGLQASLSVLVPMALLITAVALWCASRRIAIDVAKVQA
jgi:predicted MFS family arabinose efflux permease